MTQFDAIAATHPDCGESGLEHLNNTIIHSWYDFPQDFPPGLVWARLTQARLPRGAVVLDPFSGSGTTVCTAKLLGLRAIGIEANPLLAYLAAAKATWECELAELHERSEELLARVARANELAAGDRRLFVERLGMPADRLNKWLDEDVLDEGIVTASFVREEPQPALRGLLSVALSKSLYEASKVKYCPGITFLKRRKASSLAAALDRRLGMISHDLGLLRGFCEEYDFRPGTATVVTGDSRGADRLLPNDSVDLIFCSPPYPGDVEYTRLFRLEMHFLGFVHSMADIQGVKRRMVRGSPKSIFKDDRNERHINDLPLIQQVCSAIAEQVKDKNWGWDYPRMVREYFGDMWVALRAYHAVLRPGAEAQLVVGDQTVKGVLIPTGEILRQFGERLGYAQTRVELYRYRRASTHRHQLAEWIVCLQK